MKKTTCESILKVHALNWDDGRRWLEFQCSDEKGHEGLHGCNFVPTNPLVAVRDSQQLQWKDGAVCQCSECNK